MHPPEPDHRPDSERTSEPATLTRSFAVTPAPVAPTAGDAPPRDADIDRSAVALLEAERARAERRMNGIRLAVLALLAGSAALYGPHLTRALTTVNLAVLLPMLGWSVAQHFVLHRHGRGWAPLTIVNATVDLSAVTLLLAGYGVFGNADLAVKSPIWVAYFVILAARPFTGAARSAAIAAGMAVVQYGTLVASFALSGRLILRADPLASVSASGTTPIDEGTKLLLLALAGAIATYATAWNERTLQRAVAALRESEARFRHQAFHDALTGLANRALFRERVERALERSDAARERVAVLFLDLDHFKTVNDSLGHREGDRLLVIAAERLLNATRGCDTVARLGGDEFAVLLENVHAEVDATVVAERIAHALQTPIALDHRVVTVSASIGIARAREQDGAEELLRNADVAMYTAKTLGRGRHALFVPEMHAEISDRMVLEADLRVAIDRGELRLVYQPIVDLESERVSGIEALVRWEHPRRGVLSPLAFIPLAEETGLVIPLGQWVIREACTQVAHWLARPGQMPFTVSVNLSGRQLAHPELVRDVAEVLASSGLRPDCLVLEITESVIMQQSEQTLDTLRALKALGVRLAIDDFGTGYSSLSYLQRFPVDVLKIDKSFVDGIANSSTDAALARTIIALGDTLSLRTVAEGIEHADQRTLLRELGCAMGQGYLFARPLSAADVEARLLSAPALEPEEEIVAL